MIQKYAEVDGNVVEISQVLLYQTLNFLYARITGNIHAAGNTKYVETAVPLNYLSNFWRTLEM